jgi:hypothetical protein
MDQSPPIKYPNAPNFMQFMSATNNRQGEPRFFKCRSCAANTEAFRTSFSNLVFSTSSYNTLLLSVPPEQLQLLSVVDTCVSLTQRFTGYATGQVMASTSVEWGLTSGLIHHRIGEMRLRVS